jgi:hypothetical protein
MAANRSKQESAAGQPSCEGWQLYGRVELNENGEKLYIHYPSALEDETQGYVSASVLVEFGGRNITEPDETRTVKSLLSAAVPDFTFPQPTVTVLALPRTHWEKTTLVHVECNRPNPRANAERLSRHWYDVYQMSRNLTDFQSATVHELLGDVVRCKKMFFHYGYADYESCLSGGLRLVPSDEMKKALEAEFKSMVAAGMFYNEPPPFQEILTKLAEVQQLLSESITAHYRRASVGTEEAQNDAGRSTRCLCRH